MNDSIGLILLAAGGSARLGCPKQLLEYQGRSLLRRAAETALASHCRPVVVVLGAEMERCREVLLGLPVTIITNPDWEQGMATSIRCGILALENAPAPVAAAILAVCDQPLLTAGLLDALAEKHRATGAAMAAAEYAGGFGVPALFAATLFAELKSLSGPDGARRLLRDNPAAVPGVPFPGGEFDVDTAADAAKLPRA